MISKVDESKTTTLSYTSKTSPKTTYNCFIYFKKNCNFVEIFWMKYKKMENLGSNFDY